MADGIRAGSTSTLLPKVTSREVPYSGETMQAQVVGLGTLAGADDAKTFTDVSPDNPFPVSDAGVAALLGGDGAPEQVWKAVRYTSEQAGAVIWEPATGKRIAITSVLVATSGDVPFRAILYLAAHGDTTYSPGTDQPVAIASFVPSDTAKPGLFEPFGDNPAIGQPDHELMFTSDADGEVDIIVYGYERD